MKKLFGEIKLTWPRLLLLSVAAGVFTALMAMLVPDGNSFHEIAVSLEAWVLFAIFIICNCEKPLEAALKTFVFFLISQPLVYLIQVPFSWMGWGLFQYYRYWFMITLLTFPGAFIGWYIKKDNIWSGLILSVMLVLLLFLGINYAVDCLRHFPNHLISALFCIAQVPLYICCVLKNKKARIAATVISLAAAAVFAALSFTSPSMRMMTAVTLNEESYPIDSSWTVSVSDERLSTAELRDIGDGEYVLWIQMFEPERNTLVLRDGEGNEYPLVLFYEENYGLRIEDSLGQPADE